MTAVVGKMASDDLTYFLATWVVPKSGLTANETSSPYIGLRDVIERAVTFWSRDLEVRRVAGACCADDCFCRRLLSIGAGRAAATYIRSQTHLRRRTAVRVGRPKKQKVTTLLPTTLLDPQKSQHLQWKCSTVTLLESQQTYCIHTGYIPDAGPKESSRRVQSPLWAVRSL